MTPNDARSEITRLAADLLRSGLAVSINSPIVDRDGHAVRVTWPTWRNEPGLFSSNPSSSLLEYRKFVAGNHFICLMRDGGIIQISFDFENNEVSGHRMCFYPCPVLLPSEFAVSDTDELDLVLLDELQAHIEAIEKQIDPTEIRLRLRSPIRFDYAPNSNSDPSSHVHVSGPNVRVPVVSSLSVGHFVQFVLRHFYPATWADSALESVTRWPIEQRNRCISPQDELQLHLSCRYNVRAI